MSIKIQVAEAFNQGNAKYKQGQSEEALVAYEQALTLDPKLDRPGCKKPGAWFDWTVGCPRVRHLRRPCA